MRAPIEEYVRHSLRVVAKDVFALQFQPGRDTGRTAERSVAHADAQREIVQHLIRRRSNASTPGCRRRGWCLYQQGVPGCRRRDALTGLTKKRSQNFINHGHRRRAPPVQSANTWAGRWLANPTDDKPMLWQTRCEDALAFHHLALHKDAGTDSERPKA